MTSRINNAWWDNASKDEIHHRQGKALQNLVRNRIAPFCAHYRQLFADAGIDPEAIRSTDDLQRIPLTTKSDLANSRDFVIIPDEAQLRHQIPTLRLVLTRGPAGAKAALASELRPLLLTSTTGRSAAPVAFVYTQRDLDNLEESGRRLMQLCRSDQSFRHINAFPFAPHLAFWQAHYAGIGFGTFMLSTGGGKTVGTDGNIRVIDKIQPDVIIAMPTFLYHLLQQAVAGGCRWTNLKRLVLGGEKAPSGMRQKLRILCEKLGAPNVAVISTYGFTEAKMAWSECLPPDASAQSGTEESSGFHLYPDMGFVEIIDPQTGQRVPDGQPGEIVYTGLASRGTVVMRYATGDMIDGGLTYERCPHCGRTCPRLRGRISRVSDMRHLHLDKIKGTLVDFSALEHVLDDTEGLGAWQLELRKRNDDPLESDMILVHAVPLNGASAETLRHRIDQRFHEATELSANSIEFHTWDDMRHMHGVGKELKEQKVVDHRPANL